jgi:hypothetical protein
MAAQLGLPPQELRAEAKAGKVPHVCVGKSAMLFDADVVLTVLIARARSEVALEQPEPQDDDT